MATVQKNIDGNGITVTFNDGTTAEFSNPTETHLGLALANIKKEGPFGMVDVVVDNCLLKGDKKELKDNLAYCKQLSELLDELFNKIKATVEFDLLDGKPVSLITFENGVSMILAKCDRATYTASRTKSTSNPLAGLKYVLKTCLVPDDGLDPEIFKNPGILLGFSEVMDEYLNDTGKRLGN